MMVEFKTETMKAILLHSKKIDKLTDGRDCTPYYLKWYFFGFIGHKKGFVNKWYANTLYQGIGVIHILGFRFSRSIETQ